MTLLSIAIGALLIAGYFYHRQTSVQLFYYPIEPKGTADRPRITLPDTAGEIIATTLAMYRRSGYQLPWIGYLVFNGTRWVGSCAFKSPPINDQVEIVFTTFPQFEGQGIATRMVKHLIKLAQEQHPRMSLVAHTFPTSTAATRVLEKCGFIYSREKRSLVDAPLWEWVLSLDV
jgi:[ribosomal protein S5]-alanine N-acetyltransferase